ncbi:MAG: WxL protein peptidoglycan domain-containing protein [Acidimicrobiales bacterium]
MRADQPRNGVRPARSLPRRRPAAYVLARLVLVVAAAVAALVSLPGLAGAASNGSWSVFPTTAAGQQPRPYFQPLMAPGSNYPDSVTIVNQTTSPITFKLYAADAFNAAGGAFALNPPTAPQHGVGSWVHLSVSQVTVPGRSEALVPFTINPPADATPGFHVGGIVAEQTTGTITKAGAIHFNVVQAVGTRVYARIIGPLHPSLTITGVSVLTQTSAGTQFGGGTKAKVRYTIANTGNVPLAPTATVSLSPLLGGGPKPLTKKLLQILPANQVTITVPFGSVVPFGSLGAHVRVTAPGAVAAGSGSAVVVPWGIVGIVVLVIAGLVVWRRRRRHQAGPDKADEPETTPREPASSTSNT